MFLVTVKLPVQVPLIDSVSPGAAAVIAACNETALNGGQLTAVTAAEAAPTPTASTTATKEPANRTQAEAVRWLTSRSTFAHKTIPFIRTRQPQ